MEIKTKLNIRQKAWFLHKDAVRNEIVKHIHVNVTDTLEVHINYVVGDLHNMTESQLFASKEDLLKSL